jgi:hypothetical protein
VLALAPCAGQQPDQSTLPIPWLLLPQSPPDWSEILTYFRGSELQNYFQRVLEDNVKAIIKPQYVDHIPKVRHFSSAASAKRWAGSRGVWARISPLNVGVRQQRER